MPDFIRQLRLRLLELGCPVRHLQSKVQELADHREDLFRAGLAEGLTGAEAETQADERLGNPRSLAEDLMASFRRSLWFGRHRVVAFVLLPLVAFPLIWGMTLGLGLALGFAVHFGWNGERLQAAAARPGNYQYFVAAVNSADYVAIGAVAGVFCVLASRSAAGRNLTFFTCAVCTLYSLFIYAHVSPHWFTVGMTWHPQWIQGAIPLLIFYQDYLNRRRMARGVLRSALAD